MAKQKKVISTTPLGIATGFVNIHKADFEYNERGIYKVALTLDNANPATQAMINQIVSTHEASYAAFLEDHEANPPKRVPGKKPPKDPYEGDMPFVDNEDGTTTFSFKGYASFIKDGESKPIKLTVVDSRGKAIAEVPVIGAGSKLKVKYSLVPYKWTNVAGASVKLQLEGVMLVELASFGGGDDWGDDVEEGGYEASSSSSRQSPPDDDYNDVNQGDDDSDDDGDF